MGTTISYEEQEQQRKAQSATLRAENPHLIPNDGKAPSRVVAGKNVRIELKRTFPSVIFSVKTKSFSMGDDMHVSWTDGPTAKQVDAIIQKYRSGDFDGMNDLYTYSNSAWNEAFGDAKYIFANRHTSDSLTARVIEKLKVEYGGKDAPTVEDYNQGNAWCRSPMSNPDAGDHWSWQQIIRRALEEEKE